MPTKTAHKNNWRIQQSRTKIKKKVRAALLVLILLILLLVLAQISKIKDSFLGPWNSQTPAKSYLWDGQFNINMVILTSSDKATSEFAVATYNPQENSLTLMNLPAKTYLETPANFGHWQLYALYDLGESNKKGSGGKLIKDALANFLGVHFDGFLKIISPNQRLNPKEFIEVLQKSPISGLSILSNLETDLTLWELLKLKWAVMGIRFDKIKNQDLETLSVLDQEVLPDGTQIFTADPVKVDSILDPFSDPNLREENLSIAVFNATNTPQLAQKAKRMITNLGGNVIAATNAQKKIEKSYILGPDSKTLKRLRQIFDLGCSKDQNCDKISDNDLGGVSKRAQIIVVLGEDF